MLLRARVPTLAALAILWALASNAGAQPAAFECHLEATPLGPVVTSYDVGRVPIGDVRLGPGFRCRNVQAVPVQFIGVDSGPASADPGGFRIWTFCLLGTCYDGTPPRVIAPGGDVLIPIAFVAVVPRRYTTSFTILNSSGFAPTTVQLTGEAAVIDAIPALDRFGLAALAAGLAAAAWFVLRR